MNVFIFLITGIYLSVMAVIDHRLQKIPVLPGVIGILVIVLARVVVGAGMASGLGPGLGARMARRTSLGIQAA